eukprot:TRINITY_DN55698_c0_g1_i1.p1 TRINITY_DN55698_c0_g1~~TRINITY_DN55698_c0_g1_i1.p1  ORF type:complete len:406 (+),score=27.85 TRINITY_DN55698_c0_g1_i1:94-1311(+)
MPSPAAAATPAALKILSPSNGARLRDKVILLLQTAISGILDPEVLDGTRVCLQLTREIPADFPQSGTSHTGRSELRNSSQSGDNQEVIERGVASVCYLTRDSRWKNIWLDNSVPTCFELCGARWLAPNSVLCARAVRCTPVRLKLIARLLDSRGDDVLPPNSIRFVVAPRHTIGTAFPGGAVDGVGNLMISNLCGLSWQGQLAQDALVFGLHRCKSNGYYIDVGAADGELNSNTATLDRHGWSGLCIEPFPRNMGGRSCRSIRTLLHSQRDKHVLFATAGEFGGILADGGHRGDNEGLARGSIERRIGADVVNLSTERLDDVLSSSACPFEIDYLSIDVEGSELEVLEAFPFDTHIAQVITVEHNQDELRRTQLRELLQSKGYTFLGQLKWDDVFTYKSLHELAV